MKPRKKRLNALTGGTTNRAVPSGLVIAMFLGTSSPNTMDSRVATISASTIATTPDASLSKPTSSSSGAKYLPSTGSARKPDARVVSVMPSCAPESANERLAWSRATALARLSPFSLTCASTAERSSPVIANSIATNRPVEAVSNMNPARERMDMSMSIIVAR